MSRTPESSSYASDWVEHQRQIFKTVGPQFRVQSKLKRSWSSPPQETESPVRPRLVPRSFSRPASRLADSRKRQKFSGLFNSTSVANSVVGSPSDFSCNRSISSEASQSVLTPREQRAKFEFCNPSISFEPGVGDFPQRYQGLADSLVKLTLAEVPLSLKPYVRFAVNDEDLFLSTKKAGSLTMENLALAMDITETVKSQVSKGEIAWEEGVARRLTGIFSEGDGFRYGPRNLEFHPSILPTLTNTHLKSPKPSRTIGFSSSTPGFEEGFLNYLQSRDLLCCHPQGLPTNCTFPFLVQDIKSDCAGGTLVAAQNTIAVAASALLGVLGSLFEGPNLEISPDSLPSVSAAQTESKNSPLTNVPPVFGISALGKFWELWMCYTYEPQKTNNKWISSSKAISIERIWEGNLGNPLDTFTLITILSRVKEWAATVYREQLVVEMKRWGNVLEGGGSRNGVVAA